MRTTMQWKEQEAQPASLGTIRVLTDLREMSKMEKVRVWLKAVYRPWMPGVLLTALVLMGFINSTWISWEIDRLAAPVDAGVLSVLLLAVLAILIFKQLATGLCAGLLKLHLNKLTVWQKTIFYGCLYLSFFWGLVLVFIAAL